MIGTWSIICLNAWIPFIISYVWVCINTFVCQTYKLIHWVCINAIVLFTNPNRFIFKPDWYVRHYSWLSVYMISVQRYTAAGFEWGALLRASSSEARRSASLPVHCQLILQQCIVVHCSYILTVMNNSAHLNRVCIWIGIRMRSSVQPYTAAGFEWVMWHTCDWVVDCVTVGWLMCESVD